MLKKYQLLLLLILSVFCSKLSAQGPFIELLMVERRQNNNAFLINKEFNMLPFLISWKTMYKNHPFKLSKTNNKFSLEIEIPEDIICGGAWQDGQKKVNSLQFSGKTIRNGNTFQKFTLKLIPEIIELRLVKNKWSYEIQLWLKPVREFKGKIFWSLKNNGKLLAKGQSNLKILPALNPEAKMPKSTVCGIWYPIYSFANNDLNSYRNFIKKLGINLFGHNYYPFGLRAGQKTLINEFRRIGIANFGMPLGCFEHKYTKKLIKYLPEGLKYWSDWCCNKLDGEKETKEFKNVSKFFDYYLIDYERGSAREYPGLDDPQTMKAFAKQEGVKGKISSELIKRKYSKKYAAYRNSLLAAPVKAIHRMAKKVKPDIKYIVCQGSGLNSDLPYKIYDDVADYHSPMLYFSNPIDYFDKVYEMTRHLKASKVLPVPSFGWNFAGGSMRNSPQGMLMDLAGAVACGAKGILCWPGFDKVDSGMFYGYHKGLLFVAPVEDFYHKGKRSNFVKIKGVPFKKKIINIGVRKIDASQPNWNHYLRSTCWKYNGDYLVTILNFNKKHIAFSKIKAPVKGQKPFYVYNPQTKICLSHKGNKTLTADIIRKGLLVKTDCFSPSCWIITRNFEKVKKLRTMELKTITAEYKYFKGEFSKTKYADVKTGKIGAFEINWKEIDFGGSKAVVLEVVAKSQKLYFLNAGGRIAKWLPGNGSNVVGSKTFSTDGFCMDLLWWPTQTRWSGDHNSIMQLAQTKLVDGKINITYKGKLDLAIKNLAIEKTYSISSDKPEVTVKVKLKNFTPLPLKLSYWSHNTFLEPRGKRSFVSKGKFREHPNDQYYNNIKNFPVSANLLGAKKYTAGTCSATFGEYFSASRQGISFEVPKDFIQVYRWTGHKASSLEWFSAKLTIPAGSSKIISFTISFHTNMDQKKFNSQIRK